MMVPHFPGCFKDFLNESYCPFLSCVPFSEPFVVPLLDCPPLDANMTHQKGVPAYFILMPYSISEAMACRPDWLIPGDPFPLLQASNYCFLKFWHGIGLFHPCL